MGPIASPLRGAHGDQATEPEGLILDRLCAPGGVRAVFQPIVRTGDGAIVGYEALSRSVRPEPTTPDQWFQAADRLGRRVELELACLHATAEAGPPPGEALLFVNVSPALLADPRSIELRDQLPARLVLELTEREQVVDEEHLRAVLSPWLRTGARLAIDDAGAGYSSLKQVVALLPEFVKIDRSLITGIHEDRNRQALVAALAAFASEIGANLIAEGVESRAELAWLRDIGIDHVQGYLLARPGEPWPIVRPLGGAAAIAAPRLSGLAAQIDRSRTQRDACEAVAAHLFRQGGLMPSIYLELGGRLRCQAQRGLWQVLDGMLPTAGVTGLTYRTGREHHIADIASAPDYLEAIPGVVAELCVPLQTDGRTVGALNVESLVPLSDAVIDEVRACAALLGHRLGDLRPEQSRVPLRRLARTAASLAAVEDTSRTIEAVLLAAHELSGMDSAMLVRHAVAGAEERDAAGPLGDALLAMAADEVDHLRTVLEPLTSCYSAGDATGRSVTASTALRGAGARALVVLPIAALGRRTGLLICTHRDPVAIGPEQIEPLELLAVLAGSCLETAATVEELRHRSQRDPLTGLGNHSSFHEQLREEQGVDTTVLILDIDDFKRVNDTGGHLHGDDILRATAAALRGVLGQEDTLFRIGGDEFAVLLRGDHTRHAAQLATALANAATTVLGPHGAGLSIGTAHRLPAEPLIETLQRADARLYRAKHARKNA